MQQFYKTLSPIKLHRSHYYKSPLQSERKNNSKIFNQRHSKKQEFKNDFNPFSDQKVAVKLNFGPDISPVKDIQASYPGTDNYLLDKKLNLDNENSFGQLYATDYLQPYQQYYTTQPPPRSVVLIKGGHGKGTKVLLSPGNPVQRLVFDNMYFNTEPTKRERKKMKKIFLQELNSFQDSTAKKVQKHQEILDEFLENDFQQLLNSSQKNKSKKQTSKIKTVTCKCMKSKCFKPYCDCFRAGQMCNEHCKCKNCQNNSNYEEERNKAVSQAMDQNQNCFAEKIEQTKHAKGCNCKKSHCIKKYCECFQAGVKCTVLCNCDTCKNMNPDCVHQQGQHQYNQHKTQIMTQNVYLSVPLQEQYHQHLHKHQHDHQLQFNANQHNEQFHNESHTNDCQLQQQTFGFMDVEKCQTNQSITNINYIQLMKIQTQARKPFKQRHIQELVLMPKQQKELKDNTGQQNSNSQMLIKITSSPKSQFRVQPSQMQAQCGDLIYNNNDYQGSEQGDISFGKQEKPSSPCFGKTGKKIENIRK